MDVSSVNFTKFYDVLGYVLNRKSQFFIKLRRLYSDHNHLRKIPVLQAEIVNENKKWGIS